MHELSLIQGLIGLAEKELSQAGDVSKVTKVSLKVGKLSGASPEALRFAFDVIAPSTKLVGAQLNIIETNPTCTCHSCGYHDSVEEFYFVCPKCGSHDILMEGGRELSLESLDVEN